MDIKEFYTLRDNFSIIGLTGKTGSGCTRFSKQISSPIDYANTEILRTPDNILFDKKVGCNNVIFKRKYGICYNYFRKHDDEYEVISYITTILFYSIHYFIHYSDVPTEQDLIDKINELIQNNFKKSKKKRGR